MKSHFTLNRKAAVTCAVAGATFMLNGNCPAGTFIAADYATNPTYPSGWSAGQNGGYGFGPWSFDGTSGTNGPNPGAQQAISSSSAIGTAWTLFNYTANPPPGGPGISDVGRAITEPGGLQPGQTLEVVLQNPSGYHFYRGWDILCCHGTTNEPAGVDVHAIRAHVFAYGGLTNWNIIDNYGNTTTPLAAGSTAQAGMKFDLTLTSTNTYALTLTPLSDPSSAYTQSGPLVATNLPIDYINFRLYWGPSSGPEDTPNNMEISSMTITGLTLNIQLAGTNVVLSWTTNFPGYYLASSASLGPSANWKTNNLPAPIVVHGLNVVTNPIANAQQFYRLQQ